MPQFKLTIQTDSDAFSGDPTIELQRILHAMADVVGFGHTDGKIHDLNGNLVGRFETRPLHQ